MTDILSKQPVIPVLEEDQEEDQEQEREETPRPATVSNFQSSI